MIAAPAGWKGVAAGAALVVAAGAGVWAYGGAQYRAGERAADARHALAMAQAQRDAAQALAARQVEHQKTVAALDARHTQELTHATEEIDRLRADVAAGKRLRVNAQCPAVGVPAATGTAGVDDAAGPRLTDAAERDYFALRERVARSDAMIKGLQEYVREVCLAR